MAIIVEDILDDENGDLWIDPLTGDYKVGPSDGMHIKDILMTNKGEWTQSPLVGVGAQNWLDASFTLANKDKLKKEILKQLKYDGFANIKVNMKSFAEFEIDAERE